MSEKEGYTREDYFTASDEVVDSIKAEYSSVSPEIQKFVDDIATGIKKYIIEGYGEHISKEMRTNLETSDKRIILVDGEDFNKLNEDWKPDNKYEVPEASACFTYLGNMVIMRDMVERAQVGWEHNTEFAKTVPENLKSTVLSYIRFSMITSTLVHELVHSCEADAGETQHKYSVIRWALDECGSCYITDRIIKEKYPKAISLVGEYEPDRALMFNYLVGKYGEEVYDVYFSNVPKGAVEKARYEELEKNIYSEFNTKKIVQLGILTSDQAVEYDRMVD